MIRAFLLLLPLALSAWAAEPPLPTKKETLALIGKVNTRWQRTQPKPGDAFWNRAVYHTGNLAAYAVTGDRAALAYTENWARHNAWTGARSDNRSAWKYTYGETPDHVLFGDWQVCFQVYIDLDRLAKDERKVARAKDVMSYQISTPATDYIWWSDGLYMVMPLMVKMHTLTGDRAYLEKLGAYFDFAKKLMYDPEEGLFFRDAKYVYPQHKTASGRKDFWARGNGWVFAAIPRVLDELPKDDPRRDEYVQVYLAMARALVKLQQPEGYWTRSLMDPEQSPGPETSGTAFFTYGYLWGLNHGLLDSATCLPVVRKSWNYLAKTAVQADGTLGYVQPIGERAIPGQVVDAKSTGDFGVGAFLLAASEMVKYLSRQP